jgi:hypothetical protein
VPQEQAAALYEAVSQFRYRLDSYVKSDGLKLLNLFDRVSLNAHVSKQVLLGRS